MSEILTSLSSVSIILTYWLFSALMVNITLSRKFSIKKTVLVWIIELISVAVISELLMDIYYLIVGTFTLTEFDTAGFVVDLLIITFTIFGTVVAAHILYCESTSSKIFVSSCYALISLIIYDIVINIIKMSMPQERYFTMPYFLTQSILCVIIMIGLLFFTYKILAPSIKTLIDKLKGNLFEFTLVSILCTIIYIVMSSYFNTQVNLITQNSQIIPRIVFFLMALTMYLVIIYGVKRTIENIEIADELNLAKKIQVDILPDENDFNEIEGLKISAKMIPYNEIGGDFYDAFKLDESRTAFIITDVAGKGVPAAMFMMRTKSFLKSYILSKKDLRNSMTFANHELMMNNDLCMFYTAVVGVYDSKTSIFSYSCGGHFPPVLIRDGKAIELEKSNDPVIGVVEHEYHEFNVYLKKGDIIFLYTDGVTDTLSASGKRYGKERFMNLIANEIEPDKIISDLISDIDKFCKPGDYADDLTLIAFKVE